MTLSTRCEGRHADSIKAVSVQQQDGDIDCSLFSIATAYHAAMGDNLEVVTIQQEDMREHLIKCFENRQLALFPQALGVVWRTLSSTY